MDRALWIPEQLAAQWVMDRMPGMIDDSKIARAKQYLDKMVLDGVVTRAEGAPIKVRDVQGRESSHTPLFYSRPQMEAWYAGKTTTLQTAPKPQAPSTQVGQTTVVQPVQNVIEGAPIVAGDRQERSDLIPLPPMVRRKQSR